ncbi:MAG: hypothetical protein DHS20C18_25070 [Saprospiraceae bacterium]|nr:MAG: hypothetical protein DHS20C18_25070 [Saprospiraceae bacterium]
MLGAVVPLNAEGDTRTKTISRTFDAKKQVRLKHRNGPLRVTQSTDGKVHFDATISFEANSEEDAQAVFDHFNVVITELSDELNLTTDFQVENWNTNNGVTTLKFRDGTKVKKLNDLTISMVLRVPQLERLFLENKYDEINIEQSVAGSLDVVLYSGRITAKDIKGSLNLKSKYSKGTIGNFGDATLDLYDSNISFGNGENIEMTAKYGRFTLGSSRNLKLDTYDTNVEMSLIRGRFILTDKYSDFKIGKFQSAIMDLYDSDMTTEGGEEIQLKSKYTTFKIKSLKVLNFESSYDDEVDVDQLGFLKSNSKYTQYRIHTLQEGLSIISYDDEVQVNNFTGPLKELNFEGKYTDLDIPLGKAILYRLEANLTYGHLQYNETAMDIQILREKSDKLELQGRIKGASDDSPLVRIKAYDGKIKLGN